MNSKASHVHLRALEPADLQLVYDIENDVGLWPWGEQTVPYSKDVLTDYIAHSHWDLYADRQARLVVEVADESGCVDAGGAGTAVGLVDLCNFDPRHRRAEMAVAILSGWRGRGIARRALAQMEQIAHADGVELVYAITADANIAAGRLFAAAGYERACCLAGWLAAAQGQRQDATLWIKRL